MKISFVKPFLLVLGIVGMICPVQVLRAADIQGVTVFATSGGAYTNLPEIRSANNLVSAVGLFGDVHTTLPSSDMWWVKRYKHNFNGYELCCLQFGWHLHSQRPQGMELQRYQRGGRIARSIKAANISYSVDGVNFATRSRIAILQ